MFGKGLCIFIVIQYNMCFANELVDGLALVIDRTTSMGPVIKKILTQTDNIFDVVENSNRSSINEIILVTFDNPNVQEPVVTRHRNELRDALNNINVTNGGSCPEYSLSGIEAAATASKPNSILYVFTDATAADHAKIEDVKELCRGKSIQINFVLTGLCVPYTNYQKYYTVYEDLAQTTSGAIFQIIHDDVYKVFDYIKEIIQNNRVVLMDKFINAGENVQFTIDSEIKEVMISVSSKTPNFQFIANDGKVVETREVVHARTMIVDKLKVTSETYTIVFNGKETAHIVVSYLPESVPTFE